MLYEVLANEMDLLYLHDELFSEVVFATATIVSTDKQLGGLAWHRPADWLESRIGTETLDLWQKLFATLQDASLELDSTSQFEDARVSETQNYHLAKVKIAGLAAGQNSA